MARSASRSGAATQPWQGGRIQRDDPARRTGAAGRGAAQPPHCRCGGAALGETFANRGTTSLANAFVAPCDAAALGPIDPLHAPVCPVCRLVQREAVAPPPTLMIAHTVPAHGPGRHGFVEGFRILLAPRRAPPPSNSPICCG